MTDTKRKTVRIHVRVYQDTLDEILTIWPRANISEIIRADLDRLVQRAHETRNLKLQATITNTEETNDPDLT